MSILKRKHIKVVPYNPDWPCLFESEAKLIKNVLGNNCIDIHHVGSTSVPGLAAKPTIDIIAVVEDLKLSIPTLESIGYEYRGEYNIPMRYFFNKKIGADVNLHVYEEDNPEIELNLKFRNYLRDNPDSRDEYAALKAELLTQETSFVKMGNSPFTGYNLGKADLIRKIQSKTDFNRLRMIRCIHYAEWDAAKLFRQKYFHCATPTEDPYTWTFDHINHVHLVLYKGIEIIGYAHIQICPENRAALRIVIINEAYQGQGYGTQFLALIEKWLTMQGYETLHAESRHDSLNFYQKNGYTTMPFDDQDEYKNNPDNIVLGKELTE